VKAIQCAEIEEAAPEELFFLQPSFMRFAPHSLLSSIRLPQPATELKHFGLAPENGKRSVLADLL
jgi:hypothetical protein